MGSLTVQTFFAVIPTSPPSTTCWKGLAAEAMAEALAEVAVAEALSEALADVPHEVILPMGAGLPRTLTKPPPSVMTPSRGSAGSGPAGGAAGGGGGSAGSGPAGGAAGPGSGGGCAEMM